MIFFSFARACVKYKFTFALSTYNGITLILRPYNTFENIKVSEYSYHFSKLFNKAIKEMKKYRKERGY